MSLSRSYTVTHVWQVALKRHVDIVRTLVLSYLLLCVIHGQSSAAVFGATLLCQRLPGLAPRQRSICQSRPDAVVAVAEGAHQALTECRHQMHLQRWNCSSLESDSTLFGHYHVLATPEAAFSSAITSAGVAYAITRSCSQGRLSGCSCDLNKLNRATKEGWRWGGCSVNWHYGVRFTQKFLDAAELGDNSKSLVSLHNFKAGRKALKDTIEFKCKCHGVSGSCTQKTCWNSLPTFRTIGTRLTQKYHKVKQVVVVHGSRARKPLYLTVKHSRTASKPKRRDLIYLDPSPSYCEYNKAFGIPGTRARECSLDKNHENSCDILCCGRGYDTRVLTNKTQCNCKFIWCCEVICDQCDEQRTFHTCK